MSTNPETGFLQWALPQVGYRWPGFRKPKSQVIKRIRNRMQELHLSGGYSQYKTYLQANPGEWDHLEKLCDVTISKFFRDRALWDYLRRDLLKNLLLSNDDRNVTIWSAGCCNGEEPYSIALTVQMIAEENPYNSPVSILATDRNRQVLERAKKRKYPAGALNELTQDEINSYFNKTREETEVYTLQDRIAINVEFECRDIRTSLPDQTFDILFCRNIAFTYFIGKSRNTF
jgi:chemotaxis protein methyltransferase CheR